MATTFAVGHASLPHSGEVLASTARTADENSADLGNLGGAGVIVVIDMTAVPGTDTVTFTIQGKDKVSGKYYDILASAAIVATGTTVLQVHPALTAEANLKEDALLPDVWRVNANHSASGEFTYSVGATVTP